MKIEDRKQEHDVENETRRAKKSKLNKLTTIPLIIVVFGWLLYTQVSSLSFWFYRISAKTDIPLNEVEHRIENAQTLVFKGDFDHTLMKAYIEADGEYVATLSEEGVLKPTFTLSSNDENILHIRTDQDSVYENTHGFSYVSYDMNEKILGYSEKIVDAIEDNPYYNMLFFIDEQKNDKGYYFDIEGGSYVVNSNGEVLAEVYRTLAATALYELQFVIAQGASIDIEDLMCIAYEEYSLFERNLYQ